MMSKYYRMVHNYFSRTCPCHTQEISQLLVYSSTSLIVTSVLAVLFTDALEK